MRFFRPEGSPMVKIMRNMVLILFVVIFISIVYNFRNRESNTESALIAEVTDARKFKGVFIRDEIPVTYNGNGVLSYKVSDGGKLGKGSIIAEAYPDENQIAINRQIESLSKELAILEKIQNPGTLESAQPSSVSAGIEESYRSLLLCRDTGNREAFETSKEDLIVRMSTYQIITNEVSGFDQQITDIESELQQLKDQSVKPVETVSSDRPAYFVSYCDGYEGELTSKNLDALTIGRIDEITDDKQSDPSVVGKLVEGYNWYIAGVVDNSRKEYNIGSNVKIRLESSSEYVDAVIYNVRDEGNPEQSIIILECSLFNYDLVQHRTEQVEIIMGENYRGLKGLKVPRKAIRFEKQKKVDESGEPAGEESVKGVYILKGEQIEFKKIDVIYEGSDYVLSEIHEDDRSYLALYDDIMTEGVNQNGK